MLGSLLASSLHVFVAYAVGFRDWVCSGDGRRCRGRPHHKSDHVTMFLSSSSRVAFVIQVGGLLALGDLLGLWGEGRRWGWKPHHANANAMMFPSLLSH